MKKKKTKEQKEQEKLERKKQKEEENIQKLIDYIPPELKEISEMNKEEFKPFEGVRINDAIE